MFQHEARPFEISAMKPNAKNMLRSHANIRDPRADWFYKSHFLRNPNVSCQRLVERKYEIFLETFKLKGVRNKFWKAETEYFYVLCWCVMVIKSYLFFSVAVCLQSTYTYITCIVQMILQWYEIINPLLTNWNLPMPNDFLFIFW